MTDEERAQLEALWRPTLVEAEGRTYVCGAENARPPQAGGLVWLTSDEPHGRPMDPATTQRRQAELRSELDRRGWSWSLAPSRSPDGAHQELGVALSGVSLGQALELARELEQLAVFVVEPDGAMRIVWTDDETSA